MNRLRSWPLLAIWTGLCFVVTIVGLATLTPHPSGNGDLLSAAASPALSDGEVAAMGAVLWLFGVVLILAVLAARRQLQPSRPNSSREKVR